MKKYFLFLFTLLFTLCFALIASADLPIVPDVDPLAQLATLVMSWKALSPLALGMAAVVMAMGILKKFVGDFPWKRLVVVLLSCVYGLLLSLSQGLTLVPTLVAILITGGGAVALYEAFKGVKQVVSPEAK